MHLARGEAKQSLGGQVPPPFDSESKLADIRAHPIHVDSFRTFFEPA
jgi:hypothetical protein